MRLGALWAVCALALWIAPCAQAQTWARGAQSFIETVAPPSPASLPDTLPWPLSARLSAPTDRYGHDVLGGIPRWGQLGLQASACAACRHGSEGDTIALPQNLVFEDVGARLWDVTGDGYPEVVVVESDVAKGARLTVWSYADKRLTRTATTGFYGIPNRWLAVLGRGDFNGDGQPDIAYVDRPHLAKELVIVTQRGDRLVELARFKGVTNHRIGEAFISGGVRDCGNGPEAILANADWTRVIGVRMERNKIIGRDLGPYRAARSLTAALRCP